MKIVFDAKEMKWLDFYINLAIRVYKDEPAHVRTLTKMKYKFRGHPSYVWLGGKERRAIQEMLLAAFEQVRQTNSVDDAQLLKGLALKVVKQQEAK